MRDNGLSANSYVTIAELDPRLADVLLGLLAELEIAAYAEPNRPAPSAAFDAQPTTNLRDRLFVDEAKADQARELLATELPRLRADLGADPSDEVMAGPARSSSDASPLLSDEERAWAEIVAGYGEDASTPVPRWPVTEDAEPSSDTDSDGERDAEADSRDSRTSVDLRSDAGPDDEPDFVPPAERFVPPTPPPLPQLDPVTKAAWAALLSGPVLFVISAVTDIEVPSWLMAVGGAAMVGGFIALVMRLKGGPPDDEDGAIV